jgi:hypothetical protein
MSLFSNANINLWINVAVLGKVGRSTNGVLSVALYRCACGAAVLIMLHNGLCLLPQSTEVGRDCVINTFLGKYSNTSRDVISSPK